MVKGSYKNGSTEELLKVSIGTLRLRKGACFIYLMKRYGKRERR